MKLSTLAASARKRGISLIEGVLYLVIALAVIVGGIVFFQQAQLSSQVTDTARAGVGMSSQIRGMYQNQRTFGTVNLKNVLIKSGSVPSNFISSNGAAITHPFGGTVLPMGNTSGFALTFIDLSEAACLRLATAGEGGTGPLGTGISGMTFGDDNTSLVFTSELAPDQDVPITASYAATQCAEDIDVTIFYNR